MATAANHIRSATDAIAHSNRSEDLDRANTHANIAKAAALDSLADSFASIANSLDAIAQHLTGGITVQPAIHHSA